MSIRKRTYRGPNGRTIVVRDGRIVSDTSGNTGPFASPATLAANGAFDGATDATVTTTAEPCEYVTGPDGRPYTRWALDCYYRAHMPDDIDNLAGPWHYQSWSERQIVVARTRAEAIGLVRLYAEMEGISLEYVYDGDTWAWPTFAGSEVRTDDRYTVQGA